jgi:hypothetical protein
MSLVRYEVVTTQGYTSPDAPFYEAEVSVVDNFNCGKAVAIFFVHGIRRPPVSESPFARSGFVNRLDEALIKAEEHALRLNAEEQVWEATG